jgi:filamentous hemagglutinin family protein
VVAGDAAITANASGGTTINQSSAQAIIDWQTFSLAPNESVQFFQPSATSATLNRVTGGSGSFIDGLLSANGQVLILNSSGILFGSNAKVLVGGLLATTSDINNADFMAGNWSFHAGAPTPASVVNEGSIAVSDAGLAALVAPTVRNSGVIQARLGTIVLANSEVYTLDLYGDHLINFAVGQSAQAEPAASGTIGQSGYLLADGGRVLLTTAAASNVVSGTINMSGVVQARSAGIAENGAIQLYAPGGTVNVSGSLDATGNGAGQGGGSIEVLGNSVSLSSSARVMATGNAGGGNITVGRDPNDTVAQRADVVDIAPGASIDASALDVGAGGQISVWGTQSATAQGVLSAQGGPDGGNGGSIEVSTHGALDLTAAVNLNAPRGNAGTLLLDPTNLVVAALGTPNLAAPIVSSSYLSGLLQSGTNVDLQATNTILVEGAISGMPRAGVSASSPSGSIDLTAGNITIASPLITDRAPITLNATSGPIVFTTGLGGNGYLWVANSASAVPVGQAPITLNASQGILVTPTSASETSILGQQLTLGDVTLNGGTGNITALPALDGYIGTSGAPLGIGPLTISTGGSLDLSGARVNGPVDLTAASITLGGTSLYSTNGGITLQAGSGGITINPVTATGTAAQASTVYADGGGSVSFGTSGTVGLNANVTATGNVCIGGTDSAGCGSAAPAYGAASVKAATGTELSAGTVTGTQSIEIQSVGDIDLQTALVGEQGSVILNSGSSVTVAEPLSGFAPPSGSSGATGIGALSVTAADNITLNGALVGLSQATANAGIIALQAGGALNLGTGLLYARDGVAIDTTGPAGAVTIGGSSSANAGITAGFQLNSDSTINVNATPLNGGANITINNASTVTLDAGLAATGSVTIGTAAAGGVPAATVGSVNQSATSTIQAGSSSTSSGDITIDASGALALTNLLAGAAGGISLTGNGVTVSGPLNGFALANTGVAGIGSLQITSASGISLQGATVTDSMGGSGSAALYAATSFSNTTNPIVVDDLLSITAGTSVTTDAASWLEAGINASGDPIALNDPTKGNITIAGTGALPGPQINIPKGIEAGGSVTLGTTAAPIAGAQVGLIEVGGTNPTIPTVLLSDGDAELPSYYVGLADISIYLGTGSPSISLYLSDQTPASIVLNTTINVQTVTAPHCTHCQMKFPLPPGKQPGNSNSGTSSPDTTEVVSITLGTPDSAPTNDANFGALSASDVSNSSPPSLGAATSASAPIGTSVADLDSSATADSRRSPLVTSGDLQASNACPRGAGYTADLGQSPGVAGAAVNVFARCRRASPSASPAP